MKSPLPKVLHPVAGEPMLRRVVAAAKDAGAREIRVVVGYGENLVRQVIEPLGAVAHVQAQQKGTGDAVRSADPESLTGTVIILNGDHPLITAEDIRVLLKQHMAEESRLSVVSAELKSPGSYGRIVRHNGALRAIVEAKDASAETLKIREVNTGIYIADAETLAESLKSLSNRNAQGEYYLTDIVSICQEAGKPVAALRGPKHLAFGVNTQLELARATRAIFRRKAKSLLESGVILIDPAHTYIEDGVEIGAASVIYPNVYIKGATRLGRFTVVEGHSFINDCQVADSVQIKAGSYLEGSVIKARTSVGPYAHLRPGNVIGEECKIGNFVEFKKVIFADRAKASHLTYLGDAEVGEDSNIGCGTITCNYAVDRKKYRTKIGKNVFVGSDSQFVAPVEIGDNAVIASGSTITKNVPAGALAVARGRQVTKENYKPKGGGEAGPDVSSREDSAR